MARPPTAMRVLFLALMIALLPLRGWVGDVMAMERLGQALPTAPAAAVHSECHEAQAHQGHDAAHEHMNHPAGQASGHAQADCSGCTVCQICHSVVLASAPVPASTAVLPTALPPSHARLYASAAPVPGFKPPIS
ncbi:MAG: hypothetical protein O9312_04205 [Hylemonella sp.]|nr:hypothetical protein [Hylemonella sp.]